MPDRGHEATVTDVHRMNDACHNLTLLNFSDASRVLPHTARHPLSAPHITTPTKWGGGLSSKQRLYRIYGAGGRIFRSTAGGTHIRAWKVGQKVGSMALTRDGARARRPGRTLYAKAQFIASVDGCRR